MEQKCAQFIHNPSDFMSFSSFPIDSKIEDELLYVGEQKQSHSIAQFPSSIIHISYEFNWTIHSPSISASLDMFRTFRNLSIASSMSAKKVVVDHSVCTRLELERPQKCHWRFMGWDWLCSVVICCCRGKGGTTGANTGTITSITACN